MKKLRTLKDIGMIPHGEYCFSEETEHGNELMLFESDLKEAVKEWIKELDDTHYEEPPPLGYHRNFYEGGEEGGATAENTIDWIKHFFNLDVKDEEKRE